MSVSQLIPKKKIEKTLSLDERRMGPGLAKGKKAADWKQVELENSRVTLQT